MGLVLKLLGYLWVGTVVITCISLLIVALYDIDDWTDDQWVRCLLCGEEMHRKEYEVHDCDILPWEPA